MLRRIRVSVTVIHHGRVVSRNFDVRAVIAFYATWTPLDMRFSNDWPLFAILKSVACFGDIMHDVLAKEGQHVTDRAGAVLTELNNGGDN